MLSYCLDSAGEASTGAPGPSSGGLHSCSVLLHWASRFEVSFPRFSFAYTSEMKPGRVPPSLFVASIRSG
ncbi:MAG: hypothetical protein MI923_12930 [Phycisphaerales bacterium]|nr:hypothetical protein [Phycisphaerales bacterium]